MNILKCVLILVFYFIDYAYSEAIRLTSSNVDEVLGNNDVVFVNFYANWCRFSQMLEPIYDELADKYIKEHPNSKVAIAKVDCDAEAGIAQKHHINKYPTLKLFRYGIASKREFRGARSVDAFTSFLNEQTADPVNKLNSIYQINEFDFVKKPAIVGYYESDASENYATFKKVANLLRDSCTFVAGFGEVSLNQRQSGDKIVYRTIKAGVPEDAQYTDALNNYETLYAWANEKCIKIVREITFENAEELTEEGLPFLILFYKPEDMQSVIIFEREVQKQLQHERNTINAVFADGTKFTHPLHHLGKSVQDLPVLAIDSFRHMYLFPDFNQISNGNALNQFVLDLHSGKLHHDFHNPPPNTPPPPPQIEGQAQTTETVHIPKVSDEAKPTPPSTPPDSVFKKLQPSSNRYTKLKDEF